jgi:hypothetical protein
MRSGVPGSPIIEISSDVAATMNVASRPKHSMER